MVSTFFEMDDIFKIRELGVCKKPQTDERTAFTYYELVAGDEIRKQDLSLHYLFFVLSGQLEISCNEFMDRRIQSGQMIFLLRSSTVHVRTSKKCALLVLYFDMLQTSCEQHLLSSFLPEVEKTQYDFTPVQIPQSIQLFLKQTHYMQEQKVDCMHFNSLKRREFFLLLRHFCSRNEIIQLLFPLISSSLLFRNRVLDKYPQLGDGNVTKFAGLLGMGRKSFDKRFREEFGESPAQWMIREKVKRLRIYLAKPGVTVTDAMDEFFFDSSGHFNRFCHQHFNMTPGKMIKEANKSQKKKKAG